MTNSNHADERLAEGLIYEREILRAHVAALEQSEARLKEMEQACRVLMEGITDYALIMLDPDGRVVSGNAGAERLLGYGQEEIIGQHLSRLFTAEEMEAGKPEQELREAATAGRSEFEGWLVRKDGTRFWASGVTTAVWDGAENLCGYVKVVQDLTEHWRMEQALRESEARLSGIIASAMDAIITLDEQQRIVVFNAAAERMFRCPASEALGQPIDRFIPERFRNSHREDIRRFGRAGTTRRRMGALGTLYAVRADGEEFPIEAAVSQVEVAGQKLYSVIIRDITERKCGEQRLAAQYAVARVLAEASTLAEAMPKLLQTICESLGWEWGTFWGVDPQANVLRCYEKWHTPSIAVPEFEEACAHSSFPPGVGTPGRVWANGEPVWISDGVQDATIARADAAAQAGFRSVFSFPVRLGRQVLGVIEFFSREARPRDAELLAGMAAAGSQIGQFIERMRAQEALGESEARFRSVVDHVIDGIITIDEDRIVQSFNAAAEKTFGYRAEEVIGQNVKMLMPEPYHSEHDTYIANYLRTGQAKIIGIGREVVGRRKDGSSFPMDLSVSEFRLGNRRFFTGVVRDITDRKRAEAEREQLLARERAARAEAEAAQRRFAFLAEAGRILASSLDYEATLNSVAHLVVPYMADWCAVDMVEGDGQIRRVAVVHADPKKEQWAREMQYRCPPDLSAPRGVAKVLRTGVLEFYPETWDEVLVAMARDAEHLRLLREGGGKCGMIVPLVARGRTLGAISFVSAESGRHYGPDDLALAQELARDASLAVENARLYKQQIYVARTLQESLLPPRLPEIPKVEMAACYRPAYEGVDVGGDFYDVFETGPGAWAMVIGDVSGKGVDAAAVTALARYTLRAVSMYERRPSRVLVQLNEAILRQHLGDGFCTVAYVCLDLSSRTSPGGVRGVRLSVSCGGHPLPLLRRADGRVEAIGRPGTLLGLFPDADLVDVQAEMHPGDTLILYTDGVVEARQNGDLFGQERLASLVGSCAGQDAHAIAEQIERTVVAFQGGTPRDDIAILALRILPSPLQGGVQ
ncbi:MAG: PAS domain S-box protein [Armatimonadetes bacterium]|nr:PAS domain S-box protein [Armatimonadota bacterium]